MNLRLLQAGPGEEEREKQNNGFTKRDVDSEDGQKEH